MFALCGDQRGSVQEGLGITDTEEIARGAGRGAAAVGQSHNIHLGAQELLLKTLEFLDKFLVSRGPRILQDHGVALRKPEEIHFRLGNFQLLARVAIVDGLVGVWVLFKFQGALKHEGLAARVVFKVTLFEVHEKEQVLPHVVVLRYVMLEAITLTHERV